MTWRLSHLKKLRSVCNCGRRLRRHNISGKCMICRQRPKEKQKRCQICKRKMYRGTWCTECWIKVNPLTGKEREHRTIDWNIYEFLILQSRIGWVSFKEWCNYTGETGKGSGLGNGGRKWVRMIRRMKDVFPVQEKRIPPHNEKIFRVEL